MFDGRMKRWEADEKLHEQDKQKQNFISPPGPIRTGKIFGPPPNNNPDLYYPGSWSTDFKKEEEGVKKKLDFTGYLDKEREFAKKKLNLDAVVSNPVDVPKTPRTPYPEMDFEEEEHVEQA